jgi:hypothetical protein
MKDSQPHDRGIILHDVRLWLRERFGEDAITRVIARLSQKAKAAFSEPVVHKWYPVELTKEVYEAIDAEFSAQYPDTLASLGKSIAQRGVKSFLKYLVRLVSVKTIIGRGGSIWQRYHNSGSIKATILEEEGVNKRGIVTITDYNAGPVWCKLMNGYIETLVASTGARNIAVEKKNCIHKGDKVCSWQVNWEE